MSLTLEELQFKQRLQQQEPQTLNVLAPKPELKQEFSFGEIAQAAFERENTLVSTIVNIASNKTDDPEDANYDVIGKIENTPYQDYFDSFVGKVYNDQQFETMKAKIDRELQNREIINSSGALGIGMSVGAALLDPVNLIPIGGVAYKSFKAGKTLKGIVQGVEVGLASEAATEAILQSQQETRTIEETVTNIAGGAVFGGLIGGAVARLSRKEFDKLSNDTQKDMQDDSPRVELDEQGNIIPRSVGAAEAPKIDPELSKLKGGSFGISTAVIKSTKNLNPMLRIFEGKSAKAREYLPQLVRSNMLTKANEQGIRTQQSAEINSLQYNAGLAKAITDSRNTYKQFNKKIKAETGQSVGIDSFYDQVSLAMIRGDKSEIPEVEQTAKLFRSQIFDPLKEEAIKVGLLREDVDVKTATSYLMRQYNTKKIIAQSPQFKDIIKKGARERLVPEIQNKLQKTEKKIADIEAKTKEKSILDTQIKEKENLLKRDYENPKLREDLEKLKDRRLELDILIGDELSINQFIDDIADSVYDKITGLDRGGISMPYDMKIAERGPAKERVLNFVMDEELRPFLETDVTKIAKNYTRILGTDVEIMRNFGDLNLKPQIQEIKDEFKQLRDKATTEKERLKLQDEEKETIKIMEALKDALRGNYGRSDDPDSLFEKAGRAFRTLNYVTKLGGVVLSSFADTARAMMVHGFTRAYAKPLKALITNTKAIKLSIEDAKFAGQLAEAVTHQRASVMADLGNPYSYDGKFMTALNYLGENFSRLNMLDYWNNFMKGFSSLVTQRRLIDNINGFEKLSKGERQYMAFLGIDNGNIKELQDQLRKHSYKEDGYPIANLKNWDNKDILRVYKSALNTDVERTIVTKGVGDTPLLMHKNFFKTVLQFKSFAFAAHQQVLIAGLQQSDAAFVSGLSASMAMGGLVYYLKSTAAGKEVSDKPEVWVAEMFDRSGFMPILMELNGIADIGGFGVGRLTGQQPLSRFQSRNEVGALLGPSFGMTQDLATIIRAISEGKFTESDLKAIRRNIPYQNLTYIRLLEQIAKD